jgi:flagellar hook-associated protein 3 FlgL
MRIATTQYQAMMNQSLQKNQTRITELTEQMANGNRIQVPSDDPVDSVRLSRLRREEAALTQYRANIAAVQQRMSKNEGYLSNMVNDMTSGRDLLVWASDGSNTPADLNAMVTSLTALRDSLEYTANTKDQEGRYIFSGTATDTKPIARDDTAAPGSRYSYAGNASEQTVVVGNGITQAANQNVADPTDPTKGLHTLLNQLDKTIDALSKKNVDPNDPAVRTIVSENLNGFDYAMNLFSGKVAVLGGQQNILNTMDANHQNVSLANQIAITQIGQLDVGAAAIELSGYSTALQASYKAYSKIGNLSLFAAI